MTGLFYKSNKYGQAAAVLCVFFKFRRGENVKGRLNCYQATSFVFRCFYLLFNMLLFDFEKYSFF